MDRQLNHLITCAELALKNGMSFDSSNITQALKRDNDEFRAKMYKVLKHYQNGGTIFNRP